MLNLDTLGRPKNNPVTVFGPGSATSRTATGRNFLIQLAGQAVSDLASYAAILRTLKAGDKVELRYRRNDAVMVAEVVLVER